MSARPAVPPGSPAFSQWHLGLGIALVIVLGPGCTQPGPDHEGWPAQESALYEVTTASVNGTASHFVRLDLQLTGQEFAMTVRFRSSVAPLNDPTWSGNPALVATGSAATGAIARVEQEGTITFPWGVRALMPTADLALLRGPNAATSLLAGLQWPWRAGAVAWGNLTLEATADSVRAMAPCEANCGGGNSMRYVATYRGLAEGLLPDEAILQVDGMPGSITHRKLEHEAGPRTRWPLPQQPTASSQTGECHALPCEPADWPLHHSLGAGLEALGRDAAYQAWRLREPGAVLVNAQVANGWNTILGEPAAFHVLWSYTFVSPTGPGARFLLHAYAASPNAPTAITADPQNPAPSTREWAASYEGQADFQSGMVPWDQILASLAAEGAFLREHNATVGLEFEPWKQFPDPRGHVKVAVMADCGERQCNAILSGKGGQLQQINFLTP